MQYSPPSTPSDRSSTFSLTLTPPGSKSSNPDRFTAAAKRQKFLRRILKFRQMDFEFALWQMIWLCVAPQKVFRNFQYRKQTKNQWARDDPAFLVILSVCLVVSSIGFSFVLGLNVLGFFKFTFWVIFVDCIGCGLLLATLYWFIANRYLIVNPKSNQDVEWGYCFDIHLNAFFPLLMVLHVVQLPFIGVLIDRDWFISCLFGNTLWLIATGYYIYVAFLGFSALPFLKKTQVLLFPLTGLFLTYILLVLFRVNITQGLIYFYKFRVIPNY